MIIPDFTDTGANPAKRAFGGEAKTGRIRNLGVDVEVGQSTVFGLIFGLFYMVFILF